MDLSSYSDLGYRQPDGDAFIAFDVYSKCICLRINDLNLNDKIKS